MGVAEFLSLLSQHRFDFVRNLLGGSQEGELLDHYLLPLLGSDWVRRFLDFDVFLVDILHSFLDSLEALSPSLAIYPSLVLMLVFVILLVPEDDHCDLVHEEWLLLEVL